MLRIRGRKMQENLNNFVGGKSFETRASKIMEEKTVTHQRKSLAYRLMTSFSILFAIGILIFIIAYVSIKGIPYLKPSLFSFNYTSENVSLMPALITTIYMVVASVIISSVIGISTAIYLVEYAKPGSKFVSVIRIVTETLAGIPSIVYGLFGFLFFGLSLKFAYSFLSGLLTICIMILPPIVRSTEEALISVNKSYREGSYALGAGHIRTIFKIVLPVAMPGILSGVILAIGRVVGETAALLYTLGSSTNIPRTPMESGSTLALHMYKLSSEARHTGEAFATGFILLLIVFLLNFISGRLAKKLGGK